MEKRNKIIVVYKSKYGSGKQYAQWIAQALGADLFDRSDVSANDLLAYDTVIYGGSLYAVGMLGFDLIRDNFDKLLNKKVIVFSVGASPAHPEALESVKNANFTEAMKERVHYFHLRGGFNYKKLNLADKIMMALLRNKLKGIQEKDSDQIGMLAAYDHPMNWTHEKWIAPIVACAKGESAS